MRFRSRDSTTSSTHGSSWNARSNQPGATPKRCDTQTGTEVCGFPVISGEYRSISDVVVPNFKKRSAAGEVFINPMISTRTNRQTTFAARSYYVNYTPSTPPGNKICAYQYDQLVPNSPAALTAQGSQVGHLAVDIGLQNLINLAGTAASANIDNPTFDGATFIGELRETIHYMRNPLSALNKAVEEARHWKRRKRKLDTKSTAEYIADNWLSYRYSIRPLMNDVKNAAEAVARTVLNAEPVRKTARGSASESGQQTASGNVGAYSYTTSTSVTYSVRAGVLYELSRSPNTFGVGTERLGIVGWELIPLSFVADWFFNVGTFIEAITPVAGVKRLGSWTTVRKEENTHRETWWVTGGTYPTGMPRVITSDGRVTEDYTSVTTTRTPGIQIGLGQKITPLAGDIGKARILDLIALGHQILKSK